LQVKQLALNSSVFAAVMPGGGGGSDKSTVAGSRPTNRTRFIDSSKKREALTKRKGYPSPSDAPCAARTRQRLGEAGGLRDFGVNLMTLPPGSWSTQRYWHSHEDEFVYLLEGEVMLIEDGGEMVLRAGGCATLPKGTGNGHHLVNKSSAMAVYLEAGSRDPHDLTTCSDIDMASSNAEGRFVHKDGTPYSKS
jgi:uncharacterized cupin superfamily protein